MFYNFIGNDIAKQRLEISVKASQKNNEKLPNFLFSGSAGVGKTKMFHSLCEETFSIPVYINASTLDNISDLMNDIEKAVGQFALYKTRRYIIIGIDEAHALKRKVCDSLLTLISENKITYKNGRYPVTTKIINRNTGKNDFLSWVFMTNRAGELPLALKSRLTEVDFINYQEDEKTTIAANIIKKAGILSNDGAIKEIGKRCWSAREVTQTTEMLISYLSLDNTTTITQEIIEKFFKIYGIDQNGLGQSEKMYYNIVRGAKSPISLQSIAAIMDIGIKDVSDIERKLISLNMVTVTPQGRICADQEKEIGI